MELFRDMVQRDDFPLLLASNVVDSHRNQAISASRARIDSVT